MYLEIDIQKALQGFALQARFSCETGILVLFGPSGAGKSLTLQCVAGIVRPDSGRILVGDETLFDSKLRVDIPPRHRRIGYVPQDYALFPHLTVTENIAFGLRHLAAKAVSLEVARLVELLRLRGLEMRRPRELSGGQSQRVALARALATGPRLLLLDEPFSALDAPLRDALRADLCEVHRNLGVGIVFVTHGVAETHVIAQTVAVYRGGKVLQVGSPAEVFQRPATAEVARLTGARNLLPGRIVEVGSWGCRVDVGGVFLRTSGCQAPLGSRVLVALRSEYARFLIAGEEPEDFEEQLPGIVRSAEHQGHLYSVQVSLGGSTGPALQVLSPVWWWERHFSTKGEGCRLAIARDAVHLLLEDPNAVFPGARTETAVAGPAPAGAGRGESLVPSTHVVSAPGSWLE